MKLQGLFYTLGGLLILFWCVAVIRESRYMGNDWYGLRKSFPAHFRLEVAFAAALGLRTIQVGVRDFRRPSRSPSDSPAH